MTKPSVTKLRTPIASANATISDWIVSTTFVSSSGLRGGCFVFVVVVEVVMSLPSVLGSRALKSSRAPAD